MILKFRHSVAEVFRLFARNPWVELGVRFNTAVEHSNPDVTVNRPSFRQFAGERREARRSAGYGTKLTEPWHLSCHPQERILHNLGGNLARHPQRQKTETFRKEPPLIKIRFQIE